MQPRAQLAEMQPCQLVMHEPMFNKAAHRALNVHMSAPAKRLRLCWSDDLTRMHVWLCRSDDLTRTQLRAQLAEMRPRELVLPAAPLSEATRQVLKAALRQPRTSRYSAPDTAESVIEMLEEAGYFEEWPEVLKVRMLSLSCSRLRSRQIEHNGAAAHVMGQVSVPSDVSGPARQRAAFLGKTASLAGVLKEDYEHHAIMHSGAIALRIYAHST